MTGRLNRGAEMWTGQRVSVIGVESTAWDRWLFTSFSLQSQIHQTFAVFTFSLSLKQCPGPSSTGHSHRRAKMSSAIAWPATGIHGEHPSHLRDPHYCNTCAIPNSHQNTVSTAPLQIRDEQGLDIAFRKAWIWVFMRTVATLGHTASVLWVCRSWCCDRAFW